MPRWSLLLLVACAPKQAPEVPAATAPAPESAEPVLDLEPPRHDASTAAEMHAWLQLAEGARAQLAGGDLEAARASAASMAASPPPSELPTVWRPFVADLLAEATALSEAASVDAATGHLGRMGLACGTCHTEADVRDQVAVVALPPEMYDEDNRMDNHQWAADWMWFGLVTADAQAYRLGATTLTQGNLPEPPAAVSGTELVEMLSTVGAVAARAAESEDDAGRATHYAELLATCADCHALVHSE